MEDPKPAYRRVYLNIDLNNLLKGMEEGTSITIRTFNRDLKTTTRKLADGTCWSEIAQWSEVGGFDPNDEHTRWINYSISTRRDLDKAVWDISDFSDLSPRHARVSRARSR